MRTSVIIACIITLVLAAAIGGCKSDNDLTGPVIPVKGESTISALVYDANQRTPLQGVQVVAIEASGTQDDQTATTDADGRFRFTFTVDTVRSSSVMLTLRKTGYRDTVITQTIRSTENPQLVIYFAPINSVVTPGAPSSGIAQTIAFLGITQDVLTVYGVGGTESAYMDWEVRDSLGLPIDAAHAVTLDFTIANGPGGLEFLSPRSVRTNAGGQARMTVNSGIRSGVMQIVATAVVNGRTITSAPVRVVITGGFPDQAHFTVAARRLNFPAIGIANLRDQISVLVGDKYSNPAAPSVIYFRSSAGVMQGSVTGIVTDKDGQGSADLISGNPEPFGIYAATAWGDGYHYVVARTIGQAGATVTDSILLVWSGAGIISGVAPASFDIPNAGSQSFTFRVADALGHPLAEGTKISVSGFIPPPPTEGTEQNQIMIDFGNQGSVSLGDNLFPGSGVTDFTFSLRDGTWSIIDTAGTPVTITISVTGPNVRNSLIWVINGVVH